MDVYIWSDVACPWCYIGKRSFEQALEAFRGRDEVTVHWRSFELDPGAPARREGTLESLLMAKYQLSEAQVAATQARITETAANLGLEYHLDQVQVGSTFDAHRLIHLAAEVGLGGEMKERLLRAYFTEGALVSDHPTLTRLATEVGLDPEAVAELLAGDAFAEAVRADEALAQRNQFSAVPTFVVDGRYAVTGAQDPAVLLELLERAAAEA